MEVAGGQVSPLADVDDSIENGAIAQIGGGRRVAQRVAGVNPESRCAGRGFAAVSRPNLPDQDRRRPHVTGRAVVNPPAGSSSSSSR